MMCEMGTSPEMYLNETSDLPFELHSLDEYANKNIILILGSSQPFF